MSGRFIRVMTVDDSAVIRGLWARVLDQQPDMRVVATAWNGRVALDVLERREVDVVLLDVEMPELDGIQALPRILEAHPGVRVIMASSLTKKGADITVRALSLGAVDYVTKPAAKSMGNSLAEVSRDLLAKIRALFPERAAGNRGAPPPPTPVPSAGTAPAIGETSTQRPQVGRMGTPRVIGITSSTGGPNALTEVLSGLPDDFPLPILIVQHMPALFTTMLAERLQRAAGRRCVEAEHGMRVEANTTYVAPGERHMEVRTQGGEPVLILTDGEPENFCKPSADPLFRSMAKVYGPDMLGVVLTGMGQDGLEGAKKLAEAGASIVVQDAATSVVWGMPGAVARAGLAGEILPLHRIAPFIDAQARTPR